MEKLDKIFIAIQKIFIVSFAIFISVNCFRASHNASIESDTGSSIALFIIGILSIYIPITIIKLKK